jgi:Acyl-coenzyme A:6-aminopenicillanic acid acyl-transferase
VTPPAPLELLRVSGSHRDIGAAIGTACADAIRHATAFGEDVIPEGRSREEQLDLADRYREVTFAAYPWYRDEITAAAEAADVDVRALFATVIEEIWYVPYARRLEGRCSDLVAVAPATREDHVLVGHNNDLTRAYQDQLMALEITADGEPTIFAIGNGIWISCGWNDAGISMTGNELAPLDERVGIPREVQFRSMLSQPTVDRALGEALRHDRASNYNQVLVDREGTVANVEGSATDAEITTTDERGHLVHTNHYACERMRRYEGDREYAALSRIRSDRAAELLATSEPGSITAATMRSFLSDHANEPHSLCRHPERTDDETTSATVFWWVADLTDMRLTFGRGNPCDSVEQTYAFPNASGERAA